MSPTTVAAQAAVPTRSAMYKMMAVPVFFGVKLPAESTVTTTVSLEDHWAKKLEWLNTLLI